jgi:potassium uptake TrkH family protein
VASPRSGRARALTHAIQPTRIVAIGFLGAIVLGALLLSLPASKAGPGGATWNESLFTAVSSVCITGLTVVDTATFWTPFGQVVILVLAQLGGLGIMTFATFIGLIVIRRMSLSARLSSATENRSIGISDAKSIIRGVVLLSFVIEAVIAVVLALRFGFAYGMDIGQAAWFGVFHSISAFNNAGFSLFSDSMVGFAADPVICLALSVATILGGFGFPVLMQLRRHLRTPRLWSMNTRLVLAISAVLLVGGWLFITAVEWNNPATMGRLDPGTRILAGFFQSVQTRTSGFNSVPIDGMQDETLFGMSVLMFIGGGPAGTSGGIKVTTFGVLLFILIAELRGDTAVNVFGKRLSRSVHREAITVVLLAVAFVAAATIVLMLMTGQPLTPVLFETISAFATTGLTTGLTSTLDWPAQLLLCLLMLVGRIGTITFASSLALRSRTIMYQYPKERPIIG